MANGQIKSSSEDESDEDSDEETPKKVIGDYIVLRFVSVLEFNFEFCFRLKGATRGLLNLPRKHLYL